jgi:hypothetical protein
VETWLGGWLHFADENTSSAFNLGFLARFRPIGRIVAHPVVETSKRGYREVALAPQNGFHRVFGALKLTLTGLRPLCRNAISRANAV